MIRVRFQVRIAEPDDSTDVELAVELVVLIRVKMTAHDRAGQQHLHNTKHTNNSVVVVAPTASTWNKGAG